MDSYAIDGKRNLLSRMAQHIYQSRELISNSIGSGLTDKIAKKQSKN